MCSALLRSQDQSPQWILPVIENITNETDLCERCTWLRPTFSKVEFGDEQYYFLRYACTIKDGYARMYDVHGNIVGDCTNENGESECGFGFNAFTVYTLSEDIKLIWKCETGFECDFAQRNETELNVPITIDDSRCTEGIKKLTVSGEYMTFNWYGEGLEGNGPSIEIDKPGIYSVEVLDALGCIRTGSVEVENLEELSVEIKGPALICKNGEASLFTAPYQTYTWSNGSDDSMIEVSSPGIYKVTVTNEDNCEGSASITIESYEDVSLGILSTTTRILEGETTDVEVALENDIEVSLVTMEWQGDGDFSCVLCPMTTFEPVGSGEISLKVLDSRGCITEEELFIEVVKLPQEIYAPNIFSPSNAGENSTFTIYANTNVKAIQKLAIYNRWGNLVFENENFDVNDSSQGWNGYLNSSIADQGVYRYIADVLFSNGSEKIFTGEVLLSK